MLFCASHQRHVAFGDYPVGVRNAVLATNQVKEIARHGRSGLSTPGLERTGVLKKLSEISNIVTCYIQSQLFGKPTPLVHLSRPVMVKFEIRWLPPQEPPGE